MEEKYFIVMLMVICVIEIVLTCIMIYKMVKKQPISETELENFKEWLLFAVEEAEALYGSGTGAIKLRYVYDLFIDKFPALANFISFEDFSNYVNGALKTLEELIKDNEEIKKLITEEE